MKKIVISSLITILATTIAHAQLEPSFRKKLSYAQIDSAIQLGNYPQAYIYIKQIERKTPEYDAQIAQKKLDILLGLAPINNAKNPFYIEIEKTIEQLIATYDGDTKESLNVDIENLNLIQLNYLRKGELWNKWKNDKNYKAGLQAIKNKDAEEALASLSAATNEDNALAYYALGELYENGLVIPIDIDQAISYYESAADLKYGEAYAAIARCLLKDIDGTTIEELSDKEQEEYKMYLLQAIKMNSSDAMFAYAKLLLENQDKATIKKTQQKAYELMLRSAALENIYAYAELAKMHCKGIGTAPSNLEATYWINKLAETKSVSNKIIVELQDCIKDL